MFRPPNSHLLPLSTALPTSSAPSLTPATSEAGHSITFPPAMQEGGKKMSYFDNLPQRFLTCYLPCQSGQDRCDVGPGHHSLSPAHEILVQMQRKKRSLHDVARRELSGFHRYDQLVMAGIGLLHLC